MKSPTKKSEARPTQTNNQVYSTTEGRQRFPDILQTTFGEKAVIGFDRYGRALGAVVPMEAVRLLAGLDDRVDDHTRAHLQRTALRLLQQMPAEAKICGLGDPREGADVAVRTTKLKKNTTRTVR